MWVSEARAASLAKYRSLQNGDCHMSVEDNVPCILLEDGINKLSIAFAQKLFVSADLDGKEPMNPYTRKPFTPKEKIVIFGGSYEDWKVSQGRSIYEEMQSEREKNNVLDAAYRIQQNQAAARDLALRDPNEVQVYLAPAPDFEIDQNGELVQYNGGGGHVDIPGGVTIIGDRVFARKGLSSVVIPEGVTRIEECAFSGNSLTSVVIPEGVTSIGYSAFEMNYDLTSVVIPNSVTSIGDQAFYDNNLTSVVIPEGVTSIGEAVFAVNTLTSVTIPENVTSIGQQAFSENELTSVIIREGVTSIGEEAFAWNKLTSVIIPESVTSIGKRAFAANKLTSVTLPPRARLHVDVDTDMDMDMQVAAAERFLKSCENLLRRDVLWQDPLLRRRLGHWPGAPRPVETNLPAGVPVSHTSQSVEQPPHRLFIGVDAFEDNPPEFHFTQQATQPDIS